MASLIAQPHRKLTIRNCQGFSLLELLLVIGIFVTITTIGLVSYSQFNGRTLLDNLAYDIGLSIRQAQYYGLSVREQNVSGSGFETAYGIYFSASDPTSYIFFADANRNGEYDGDSSCDGECIDRFSLGRGYIISELCAVLAGGTSHCMSTGELTYVAISFDRPDPDAIFHTNQGSGVYEEVTVVVRAPRGREQNVSVASTGQIGVGTGVLDP
ncbi:MAG TPA: type II secretion system protein [Candidatus Paceibacterota bacterium]